jgi:hypothetical protein
MERGERREREREEGKIFATTTKLTKRFQIIRFFFFLFKLKHRGEGSKNNRECARVVWCGEGDNGEKNNPKLTP